MDRGSFDRLTRSITNFHSRRAMVGAFGLGTLLPSGVVDAKKRKKRRKQTVKFNDFGCVNVGGFCKNDDQCCSGICQGKKGKRKCQAHDDNGCQAGDQFTACGGDVDVSCTTSDGFEGVCNTTTGKAGFCTNVGACTPCSKDADCVPFCGAKAACIICDGCEETGFTSCVGPGQCDFSSL